MEKVEADENDDAAIEISKLLFDTAALRSGYGLKEPVDFADRILNIMYANLEIDPETPVSNEYLYFQASFSSQRHFIF